MKHHQHVEATALILGDGFANIHAWIDRFAPQHGHNHRQFCHHQQGIEDCRAIFGDIGALVMKIHLYQDLGAAFPIDANWRIAKDQQDFIKQGLI